MFDKDLLIAFGFMALLFLRHIAILKKPNKINYAPLMLAIGAIATLIHFMIHPDLSNVVLLMRESLMPLLVAVFLYIVMNILNQTKESFSGKLHDELSETVAREITELKRFISEIEDRLHLFVSEEKNFEKDMRAKFSQDIKALQEIQKKQLELTQKFDKIEEWYEVQIPELDTVLHKHLEVLRIAQQNHYNKVIEMLRESEPEKYNLEKELHRLHKTLGSIATISDDIAKSIIEKTHSKLSTLTTAFEGELISLKLHAEGTKTLLYEDENILGNIRMQSEMIMKQMKLSADKMYEIEHKSSSVAKVYDTMNTLFREIETIKSDYLEAHSKLAKLAEELSETEDANFKEIQTKIDILTKEISQKIENSLEKLYKHYHISNEKITQSVKIMAQKAQLKKGYSDFEE